MFGKSGTVLSGNLELLDSLNPDVLELYGKDDVFKKSGNPKELTTRDFLVLIAGNPVVPTAGNPLSMRLGIPAVLKSGVLKGLSSGNFEALGSVDPVLRRPVFPEVLLKSGVLEESLSAVLWKSWFGYFSS